LPPQEDRFQLMMRLVYPQYPLFHLKLTDSCKYH
jgi:hypothetical protein